MQRMGSKNLGINVCEYPVAHNDEKTTGNVFYAHKSALKTYRRKARGRRVAYFAAKIADTHAHTRI